MKDGMYGNFSGRDASRGLAKQSFDQVGRSNLQLQEPEIVLINNNLLFHIDMLTPVDQLLD